MAVIEAIATTYLEADAASVTFSSLGSYEHLQLRFNSRSDAAGTNVVMQLNADTGTNYSSHFISATDSTVGGWEYTGLTGLYLLNHHYEDPVAFYSSFIVDILDYRNGNKNTTIQFLNFDRAKITASTAALWFGSGLWDDTAAVTSVTVIPAGGDGFARGSEFTLYGLNSA